MTIKPVRIRREVVGSYTVSCVLALGEYEVMTFKNGDEIGCRRFSTAEAAIAHVDETVAALNAKIEARAARQPVSLTVGGYPIGPCAAI